MARIRSVKPEYFIHERALGLKLVTRFFFIGFWTQCDKAGRIALKPRTLKHSIIPEEKASVPAMLDELEESGFIHRYEVRGETFAHVMNWAKHQHPHPKEQPSKLPPCPMHEPCMDDASGLHEQSMVHAPTGLPGGSRRVGDKEIRRSLSLVSGESESRMDGPSMPATAEPDFDLGDGARTVLAVLKWSRVSKGDLVVLAQTEAQYGATELIAEMNGIIRDGKEPWPSLLRKGLAARLGSGKPEDEYSSEQWAADMEAMRAQQRAEGRL